MYLWRAKLLGDGGQLQDGPLAGGELRLQLPVVPGQHNVQQLLGIVALHGGPDRTASRLPAGC